MFLFFMKLYLSEGITAYIKRTLIFAKLSADLYGIFPAALQRQNTKISKQIFPEKEYRGLSPNFHIHTSVSDL